MKKMALCAFALMLGIALCAAPSVAADRVIASFEKDAEGWEVPEWALEKTDHVAKSVSISNDFAKDGKSSLKMEVDFPGKVWTAAIVETMESFDFTPYSDISCDVYIPKEAPEGMKAKIILTVGEGWKWTEMSRAIALVPGQWVTITANLLPGSTNWQRTTVDDNFRKDVRKISIRVESNKKPVYKGPIYIDNVKVTGTATAAAPATAPAAGK
jgi:hypothetical protein